VTERDILRGPHRSIRERGGERCPTQRSTAVGARWAASGAGKRASGVTAASVKPLHEWSGRRLTAVALGWLFGIPTLAAPAIFGAVGWLARAERDRQVVAAGESVAPGLRLAPLPGEPGDFLLSVVGPELLMVVALFLLPPAALSLAWLAARRRRAAT
jgi:hypothetical protein